MHKCVSLEKCNYTNPWLGSLIPWYERLDTKLYLFSF